MQGPAPASAPPAGVALPRPRAPSGPLVATAFQRAFALVLLVAWWSLGRQVLVLVGSRGLLPAQALLEEATEDGASMWQMPTLFCLGVSDRALVIGVALGALLALLALAGMWPRVCFALSAPLYLSYTVICDDFTSFQWDNMLVETALLAAFLPAHRPAPIAHFVFRLLLFKLYFESGIAKWQSYLGDWQDGRAMAYYYETAPIPTRLVWYAHHLPASWHKLESWGALVLELLVPFLIWGGRRARLLAFAAFTSFQIINTATANYGFFTYLSLALHVFLLADRDLQRVLRRLPQRLTAWLPTGAPRAHPTWRWHRAGALALTAGYASISLLGAFVHFAPASEARNGARKLYRPVDRLRVANVYHLFGHITRERIEPTLETRGPDGWRAHDMRYKPGEPTRAPPYVAPHQPRVDFRLWFYGLGYGRGMPYYVRNLLTRMCDDPEAVRSLFVEPLPSRPEAVRIAFYRYHFTTPARRAARDAWWTRELLATTRPRPCDR